MRFLFGFVMFLVRGHNVLPKQELHSRVSVIMRDAG